MTQGMVFSSDETTDLSGDGGTPVSDDYVPRDSAFTGQVRWVQRSTSARTPRTPTT
jgi:hypothetical protein